jgi:hypothetical protein
VYVVAQTWWLHHFHLIHKTKNELIELVVLHQPQAYESAKMVEATVTVMRADNTVLESGNLNRLTDSFEWEYFTTQVNAALAGTKIIFTITDAKGNKHTVKKTL